jgi:pimeloyl-ACP methyl ester carboxylesterase
MRTEHHHWYSGRINREMGVAVYGHWGPPMLVFPTSGGDEWEMDRQGMIGALAEYIDGGRVKVFSINANSGDAFYNKGAHPFHRSYMQAQYDAYVRSEVVPFIRSHCQSDALAITTMGASLGAYHAANSLFKHPDVFRRCYALSGVYDMKRVMESLRVRNPPGDRPRTVGRQGPHVPAGGHPRGKGHSPLPGRLGAGGRARLAVLEAPDARVPVALVGLPGLGVHRSVRCDSSG